jgi:hypothetical protein
MNRQAGLLLQTPNLYKRNNLIRIMQVSQRQHNTAPLLITAGMINTGLNGHLNPQPLCCEQLTSR